MKKTIFFVMASLFFSANGYAQKSGNYSAASLSGSDSNNNQVRDDVEKALALIFTSKVDLYIGMSGAYELQKIFTNTKISYAEAERNFTCATIALGEKNQELIKSLVFNTPERQAIIKKSSNSQPTSIEITIDNSGNAVNPCKH